jgi:hypothetical protein
MTSPRPAVPPSTPPSTPPASPPPPPGPATPPPPAGPKRGGEARLAFDDPATLARAVRIVRQALARMAAEAGERAA